MVVNNLDGLDLQCQRIKEQIKTLRERVRVGEESIGTSLENLLFSHFGLKSEGKWKPYLDLSERLKENKGKEILICIRNGQELEEPIIRGITHEENASYGRGAEYRIEDEVYYGTLDGRDLAAKPLSGEVVFPLRDFIKAIVNYCSVFPKNIILGKMPHVKYLPIPKEVCVPICGLSDDKMFGKPKSLISSGVFVGEEIKEVLENDAALSRIYEYMKKSTKH